MCQRCVLPSSSLKALYTSEMVYYNGTTRRNIPEGSLVGSACDYLIPNPEDLQLSEKNQEYCNKYEK
jgi:hypothetical protein